MSSNADALADFLAKARGSLDRRAAANAQVDVAELWSLAALRGRLVELSARGASATLTTAIDLVLEAQLASEPVVWIMLTTGTFYPPDVADSGVDLAALVVIRVTDATGAARAAERVLRSGAFGLVVLDLSASGAQSVGSQSTDISMAHQGRSSRSRRRMTRRRLTDKTADTASLGSRSRSEQKGARDQAPPTNSISPCARSKTNAAVLAGRRRSRRAGRPGFELGADVAHGRLQTQSPVCSFRIAGRHQRCMRFTFRRASKSSPDHELSSAHIVTARSWH
jgi:recombination protein RecA